eukprot:NODE_731_length_2800_cov_8.974186.p1 GENE.NODE_731_length_2800_cov_8.974186~~NODE_731_length_2800_cov_8.974186.p1  ORF type:complete len:683 (-),score=164.96 NODE_731_length_2800_cov_8.974186:489-2537(-)
MFEMQTWSLSRPSTMHYHPVPQREDSALLRARWPVSRGTESLIEDGNDLSKRRSQFNTMRFVNGVIFQSVTVAILLVNAVMIGIETDFPNSAPWNLIELVFLLLLLTEVFFRMHVLGCVDFFSAVHEDFFWNIFDLFVVCSGFLLMLLSMIVGWKSAQKDVRTMSDESALFRMVRMLRILRILRLIRLVRFLKQLDLLAYGLSEAGMAIFWAATLATFFLYTCTVVLVNTYGEVREEDPQGDFLKVHFSTIPMTMLTLFDLIAAPDIKKYHGLMFEHPALLVFIVTFIILGSLGINGLLIALVNEGILQKSHARNKADRVDHELLRAHIMQSCLELFDSLDVDKTHGLLPALLKSHSAKIEFLLERCGVYVARSDLDQMFHVAGAADNGVIDRMEFATAITELCETQVRPVCMMDLRFQLMKCVLKIDGIDKTMEQCLRVSEETSSQKSDIESSLRSLADSMAALVKRDDEATGQLMVARKTVCRDAEVLDKFADTLRQQQQLMQQVSTIGAGGLGGMPLAASSSSMPRPSMQRSMMLPTEARRDSCPADVWSTAEFGHQPARRFASNARRNTCNLCTSVGAAPSTLQRRRTMTSPGFDVPLGATPEEKEDYTGSDDGGDVSDDNTDDDTAESAVAGMGVCVGSGSAVPYTAGMPTATTGAGLVGHGDAAGGMFAMPAPSAS